jgi:hypothetical protein
MFAVVQDIVLPFWELLAYAYQVEIVENIDCLMLNLDLETVLPSGELRRQMASAVAPVYAMDGRSWLMIG